jgi:putative sterol carrier protein
VEDLQKVRTIIVYEVKIDTNTKKYWFINTREPALPAVEVISASQVEERKPHCILKCDEKTVIGMAEGSLSPEFAYLKGSLSLEGNMNSAMKLKTILGMVRESLSK